MSMPTRSSIRHSGPLLVVGLLLSGFVSFGSLTLVQTNPAQAGQSGLIYGLAANSRYTPRYNPSYSRNRRCYAKRHHLPRLNDRCNSQRPGTYFSVATCRCETLN